jgi:2'-5' RNA ligase
MTAKTHKTAVVLTPPQERWEPIQAIRRRHDRHLRRWMPHVTLIYPFRPREQLDEVEPSLHEACSRIEPFEVCLAEFRHFHHGRERFTLWLAPEPRDSLVALQTALESVVPDCDDLSRHPDGFTPHLSVGQVSGRDAMAALKTTLQASWQPLTFSARRVSLIWRADKPDDVFRVDRQIELGQ